MNPSNLSQKLSSANSHAKENLEDAKNPRSKHVLRLKPSQNSQQSCDRGAEMNKSIKKSTENPSSLDQTSKEEPQTNDMKETVQMNFAKTEKQNRRPLTDISDLTNVKKRLFDEDDDGLTATHKKSGMPQFSSNRSQIESSENINERLQNIPQEDEGLSSKRRSREFDKFENKLYVHTKRGKTSRPFQEDIVLFDFANKRELKFRLFKDKDLRISSYHQRIVHESKLDDDCPTDSQQLEIACSHVKEELDEAIQAQKEKSSETESSSTLSSFEESLSSTVKTANSENTFTTDGYFPNDYKPSV